MPALVDEISNRLAGRELQASADRAKALDRLPAAFALGIVNRHDMGDRFPALGNDRGLSGYSIVDQCRKMGFGSKYADPFEC